MQAPLPRPAYALFSSLVFWTLLAWCVFDAVLFIATNSTPILFADDTTLIDGLHAWENGWFSQWMWTLHNEHREPLPKLLWIPLFQWTGDVRSSMYAQVALLACAAILGRSAALRWRGLPDISDAFFPLAFLQIANHENFLMGFQVCIALPVLMVVFVIWALARPVADDRSLRSAFSALCIAGLPLCGGYGLIMSVPLVALLAWRGWLTRRSASGKWLLCGAGLALLALGAYMHGYERPPSVDYEHSIFTLLKHVPVHWGIAFGPYSSLLHEWLVYPLAMLLLGSLAWSGWKLLQSRGSDGLHATLFAVLVAAMLYGISMSRARPPYLDWMVANRYMPFPQPFLVVAILAALSTPWRGVRFLVPLMLALGMVQAQPAGNQEAYLCGSIRSMEAAEIQALADGNVSKNILAQCYQKFALNGDVLAVRRVLLELHRRRMPPYAGLPDAADIEVSVLSMDTPPDLVLGPHPLVMRQLDSEMVVIVQAPATLQWMLWGSEHSLGLLMEPPLALRQEGRAVIIGWQVEWHAPDGKIRVLAEGKLTEPLSRAVAIPEGASGNVRLVFLKPSEDPAELARAWVVLRNLKLE